MESADERRLTQMVSDGLQTADDTDSAENVWKPQIGTDEHRWSEANLRPRITRIQRIIYGSQGWARMATMKESRFCVAARTSRGVQALASNLRTSSHLRIVASKAVDTIQRWDYPTAC
jgi:hypothetical protein